MTYQSLSKYLGARDMTYQHIKVPSKGEKITVKSDLSLNVPSNPIIPYIEGDGIGVDITPVDEKSSRCGSGKSLRW